MSDEFFCVPLVLMPDGEIRPEKDCPENYRPNLVWECNYRVTWLDFQLIARRGAFFWDYYLDLNGTQEEDAEAVKAAIKLLWYDADSRIRASERKEQRSA